MESLPRGRYWGFLGKNVSALKHRKLDLLDLVNKVYIAKLYTKWTLYLTTVSRSFPGGFIEKQGFLQFVAKRPLRGYLEKGLNI